INIDKDKLTEKFNKIAEKHVKRELIPQNENDKKNKLGTSHENKIIEQEELSKNKKQRDGYLRNKKGKAFATENLITRKKTTLDDFNRR
ncbi:MAG TPA: hypothetical protein VFV86_00505, partial [Nitrososphaeraceae archaeon]|nr:hypothetical protein [Nitrososphaeraceae archaeon]